LREFELTLGLHSRIVFAFEHFLLILGAFFGGAETAFEASNVSA
jgi:hypothetical protein